jgi:protein-tyrosine phosphatase
MSETNPRVPYANTYWVVPGQFLAGENPEVNDDQTLEESLSALLAAGIRTFIDLTEEHELNGYALILRCLAEERGLEVTYVRIPIPDRCVPSAWTLRCILDLIDHSIADQRAAFVHCFAGIGRTGTVVGCHLRRHQRAKSEDVMARIAELRQAMPIALEISPHALEQVQMVEGWNEGV